MNQIFNKKIQVMALRLRINEAIAMCLIKGRKVLKKDIAVRLWPGIEAQTQQVNMTNLVNGTTKRVKLEWIGIICEMCDCDPNYLLGWTK